MWPTPKIPISNPSMRANVQTNRKALQKTSHDVTSVLEHDELFVSKALWVFLTQSVHIKLGKSVMLHLLKGPELRMHY